MRGSSTASGDDCLLYNCNIDSFAVSFETNEISVIVRDVIFSDA